MTKSEIFRLAASVGGQVTAPADSDEGKRGIEWLVTIIGPAKPDDIVLIEGRRYIRSLNGRLYLLDMIHDSAPRWEGVKVYDNHLTDQEFAERGKMRSFVSEGVGIIRDPFFDDATDSLRARLVVVDDGVAKKLLNAYSRGVLDAIGLSIDTVMSEGFTPRRIVLDGQKYEVIDQPPEEIVSVDVVSEPALGGRFDRLIAANQNLSDQEEENSMDEQQLQELMAYIDQKLAEMEQRLDQKIDERLAAQEEPPAEEEQPEEQAPPEETQPAGEEEEEVPPVVTEMQERLTRMEQALELEKSDKTLQETLDKADLPDVARVAIEEAFKGKVFEREVLLDVIKRAKEAQAKNDDGGRVKGSGSAPTLRVAMDERDKAQLGLIKLMEMRNPRKWNLRSRVLETDVDYVRERIPASLRTWMRNGKPNYGRPPHLRELLHSYLGDDPFRLRLKEANDIAVLVGDAINLFVAVDYSQREEWWRDIVTEIEVPDLHDVKLARIYGLSSLSEVPAGGAYVDLSLEGADENASYAKYGNTISLTLEDMINDRVDLLTRIPQKLADAWYSNQSELVANVFTVNSGAGPVLTDTGALFNATATTTAGGHANLGTSALAYDAFGAARTAMMKQTTMELGQGKRLALSNVPRYLLVSVDNETAGLVIRNTDHRPGGNNNDINPYYQSFDVIPVPEWTDANDWALVADPTSRAAIYMVYVSGHRVPEIFSATNESGGSMFTNDTLKWKVRQYLFRHSSTYNCAPVADFRPLYKSNVS